MLEVPTRPRSTLAKLIRHTDIEAAPARERRASSASIGTHVVADFWECTYEESAAGLTQLVAAAARAANATVLDSTAHEFGSGGGGTTVLLLLAESHLSLHTWPEYGFVAIDVFTCGQGMRPRDAVGYLEEQLAPARTRIQVIERGLEDG